MSVIEGTIDHFGRPIINIRMAPPSRDSFTCLVDTGFNRNLLLSDAKALDLGFRPLVPTVAAIVMLAGGGPSPATLWRGSIVWFEQALLVDAHVIPGAWMELSSQDRPDAYLGVGLLAGLHVFFDFQFGRVTIQKPPPQRQL